jgi:hypothetical protein
VFPSTVGGGHDLITATHFQAVGLACDRMHDQPFQGSTLDIRFVWDEVEAEPLNVL